MRPTPKVIDDRRMFVQYSTCRHTAADQHERSTMTATPTPGPMQQLVGMVARKGPRGREEDFGLVEGVFVGYGGVTFALIRRPDGVLASEYLEVCTYADVEG